MSRFFSGGLTALFPTVGEIPGKMLTVNNQLSCVGKKKPELHQAARDQISLI